MTMTDPIADMLTRIRNGIHARHSEVVMPASKVKREVARVLKDEGYIVDFSDIKDDKQGMLKVKLKYADTTKQSAITGIKRVSKPGLRKYVGKDEIPRVLNGLGIAVLTTSNGVISDRKARELGVGGEILCMVY